MTLRWWHVFIWAPLCFALGWAGGLWLMAATDAPSIEPPVVIRHELVGDGVVCALVPQWRAVECVYAWPEKHGVLGEP